MAGTSPFRHRRRGRTITTREKSAGGMPVARIAFGLGFVRGPRIDGLAAKIDPTELISASCRFSGSTPFSTSRAPSRLSASP